MTKKKSIEKEMEKNQADAYRISFWILLIAFAILFFTSAFNEKEQINQINYNCDVCKFITSTPSWLLNGRLIGTGFQPNITTEIMIEKNITFIYRDGCGWCDKQKELLDIDELKKRGLALKC